MKILVIDDEEIIRRSLKRAFEVKGHIVVAASDGISGLNVWLDFKPDIVLLDVIMPGLTGPQVLGERTKNHTGIVCLMSAFSGEYSAKALDELGIKYFLPKPFTDIFELVKSVESWSAR